MKCRLCGSTDLGLVFEADKCPKFSHKYLTEQQLPDDSFVELRVLRCRHCGLMQLESELPNEEYSSDYQRNIAFSRSAVEYVEKMADKLARDYRVTSIVEVGCGNGLFSSAIMKRGVSVVAFEPSRAACRTAKANGVDAHNVFFDDKLSEEFSGYDGFAMRFVLEHIGNPLEILRCLNRRCKDGAVGLIEVPNAQQQLDHGRWFEFFPEHVLYFTPATLIAMLDKIGFELLEMETPMDGDYINVVVKKTSKTDWGAEDMKSGLRGMIEPGKTTWAWGASGGGITLLAETGLTSREIGCIVDSDKNKWGLYASGSRIKIVSPETLAEKQPDRIIIISTTYEKEIKKAIRDLGFKGKIGSLIPNPRWLEE